MLPTTAFASVPVELHAHLHGSMRLSTLVDLAAGLSLAPPDCLFAEERTLAQCFTIFALIHQLVTSDKVLRRIIREVLTDFHAENCCYLELRTTPRCLSDGASKAGYVTTLLEELESFEVAQQAQQPPQQPPPLQDGTAAGGEDQSKKRRSRKKSMMVRALLSIDRSGSVEDAMETVKLAAEAAKKSKYVVGIDLSGNPRSRASFSDFKDVLTYARSQGLRITVHCGEVDNDAETADVLLFRPERLGHALFLNDANLRTLQSRPIPIEICPSSNFKTLELASHSQHPTLERFLKDGYPLSINTDDCGVFSTTCSKEYEIVAKEFDLSPGEVWGLACAAVDQIFEDDVVKGCLRQRFETDLQELSTEEEVQVEEEGG